MGLVWLIGSQSTFFGRLAECTILSQNWRHCTDGKNFPECSDVVLPYWCAEWVLTSWLQGLVLQREVSFVVWWGYVPAGRASGLFVDDAVSKGKGHLLLLWDNFQSLWWCDMGLSSGASSMVEELGTKKFWDFFSSHWWVGYILKLFTEIWPRPHGWSQNIGVRGYDPGGPGIRSSTLSSKAGSRSVWIQSCPPVGQHSWS